MGAAGFVPAGSFGATACRRSAGARSRGSAAPGRV